MKIVYRGHEIDCHRDIAMGGCTNLYYSIFRLSDGLEVTSGFSGGADKVRDFIGYMKERVNGYILDPSEEFPDATEEQLADHKKRMEGL